MQHRSMPASKTNMALVWLPLEVALWCQTGNQHYLGVPERCFCTKTCLLLPCHLTQCPCRCTAPDVWVRALKDKLLRLALQVLACSAFQATLRI